jgi:hypothetical protein
MRLLLPDRTRSKGHQAALDARCLADSLNRIDVSLKGARRAGILIEIQGVAVIPT